MLTDIPALRKRLGLTQAQFAARYGLELRTVQAWEIGRQSPRGGAATLLRLIEIEPEAVARLVAQASGEDL